MNLKSNHKDHILINGYKHIPYTGEEYNTEEMIFRSESFHKWLDRRRSVREFSQIPVPKEVIDNVILSASTAPSGAHKQPWAFCAVSNPALKSEIRHAAEIEERENYSRRMSEQWKKDLEPLATDMNNGFLEDAPWLIVVFKQLFIYGIEEEKNANYYVNESVGIACGMLISAIHNAGLVTLTHTPSPMRFLTTLLGRPDNERPYLLLPVGLPRTPTYVPQLKRKTLTEVSRFYI